MSTLLSSSSPRVEEIRTLPSPSAHYGIRRQRLAHKSLVDNWYWSIIGSLRYRAVWVPGQDMAMPHLMCNSHPVLVI